MPRSERLTWVLAALLLACGETDRGDGTPANSGSAGASQGGSAGSSAQTGGSGATGGDTASGGSLANGGTASGGDGAGGTTGGSAGSGSGGTSPCGCAPSDLQCNINCGGDASGDCTSDKECGGTAQCIELSPGGYRVCAPGPIEATGCTNQLPSNECCQSSDCDEGLCVTGPGPTYCGGPVIEAYNYCASDECQSSADCDAVEYGVCFPAGAYGFPVATCRAGSCRVDADCAEEADGRCLLIQDPCCGTPSLACVYPGGCQTLADCAPSDQTCQIEDGRGVCSQNPAVCPL